MLKIFSDFLNSKEIKAAAIGSLAIKFLSALFSFLNTIILARILSLEDFGIYVLAFTTISLLIVPASLGFSELITRYVSKYNVQKQHNYIKGLLIKSDQYALLAIFVVIIIATISYFVWWNSYSGKIVSTFFYAFILIPLLVLSNLKAAALRGLKYVALGQLQETLIRNIFLCFLLLILVFSDYEITPEIAMIIHVIAASIALLTGYIFLRNKYYNKVKTILPEFEIREWLKQGIPFSITQSVSVLKTKSITYILIFFGSLESVALFDVAMKGATLVAFTLGALNNAISPFISASFERNNLEVVQKIVNRSNRIVFLFALPVALIFIVGGRPLITILFSDKYIATYIPLVIVCIGQLINACAGAAGPVLNMTGHQSYLSRNQIQMLVLSIIISVPLVMMYDVTGAAVAFSVTIIIQNVLLVMFIKKRLNINTSKFFK